LLEEMTRRYLPPDKVSSYLEFSKADLSDEIVIYLRPEHWFSADLGTW
jgi:hypothetical protein